MSTFCLLSPYIQKKIWEMRWDSFTPVQDETIPLVIETEKDIIISSGTASGKTEAAFLPILSLIESEGREKLKVIYISPLKALINNQFDRIIQLCESNDIPIHRWHGDVSQSKKSKFVKQPAGILQITPESIESLFINRTEQLKHIFKNVDFIVIDEIHSFIDSERGVHLRSLLSRLGGYTSKRPRIIGLSATIDNFGKVKEWVNFNNPEEVVIVQSRGYDKKLHYSLMYFETGEDRKKPIELFRDIRELTRAHKAIIFCNSRGEVEELTYYLNRLSEREKMGECYFAHHSSIDKAEREYVEKSMAESNTPKSVIATSSLELGIDIGDVDIVIQVDSTFTVSSLKQRLGRSGRKKGANQMLQLYATNEDSLLQSLAVMELNLEGWIEPAKGYGKPYDIAFQQIISLCTEANGLTIDQLVDTVAGMGIFYSLKEEWMRGLVLDMIDNDILEEIYGTGEIIVGLEGEKILRSKDFYAVFMSQEEYTVLNGPKKIGTLDKSDMINVGDNIILAGKLWTIQEVDAKRNKIYVSIAVNGNPPRYTSGNIKIHHRIGEKMMEILCSNTSHHYMGETGIEAVDDMRRKYHFEGLNAGDRPIWISNQKIVFETFTGTVIAKTIYWMLEATGLNVTGIDGIGRIEIAPTPRFEDLFQHLYSRNWMIEDILKVTNDFQWFESKYTPYLPGPLVKEMHMAHEIDLEGASGFLKDKNIRFIYL
ncbi:DEAD/DEAH box helicase [Evansella clarkii]|uniref:DEAD/DEAH box helicase n=1 Tax=Evansella clarkii TaxID=79879 RepID=UPI000995E325|nr:DEAD/DEAH box helicase [Evansella clarkii]